jgi:hypothetical protein
MRCDNVHNVDDVLELWVLLASALVAAERLVDAFDAILQAKEARVLRELCTVTHRRVVVGDNAM